MIRTAEIISPNHLPENNVTTNSNIFANFSETSSGLIIPFKSVENSATRAKTASSSRLSRGTFIGLLSGVMASTAFALSNRPIFADSNGGIGSSSGEPKPVESFDPEVPQTGFGEDPVSPEAIESRKPFIKPIRWVEIYAGKGDREGQAEAFYKDILAAAMGYEGGGLAATAKDLNDKMSSQPNPRNNTPGGMIKLGDYGLGGIAQLGVIAPMFENCTPANCPPVNPNVPISLIRGVKAIETNDGRRIPSFNNGVVIGFPSELNPKDLATLMQSVTYVREGITIGNRMMDQLLRENSGVTIEELTAIVKDPNSEFNLNVKSQALRETLRSADTLHSAAPTWWDMKAGFADTLEGYRRVLPGGEAAVLEYTRSKSVV